MREIDSEVSVHFIIMWEGVVHREKEVLSSLVEVMHHAACLVYAVQCRHTFKHLNAHSQAGQ